MKNIISFIYISVCIYIIIFALTSPPYHEVLDINIHRCNWEDCDYIGMTSRAAKDSIYAKYPGDDGDTPTGKILHIMYPNKSYEQIEDMMFDKMK